MNEANAAAKANQLSAIHAAFLETIDESMEAEKRWRRRFLTLAGLLAAGGIVAVFFLFR